MHQQYSEAIQARVPSPPQPAPVQRTFARQLLVAVILFVLIVGGLAWLVQYLPNWRKKPAPKISGAQQLVFLPPEGSSHPELATTAQWDPSDPKYAMEFEHGQEGHYDFAFRNALPANVELGLIKTSCDCSKVEMAILSESEWATWQELQKKRRPAERPENAPPDGFTWNNLTPSEKSGLPVPGDATGLVRVSWKTRKSEGQQLRLAIDLWNQPEGQSRERRGLRLETGSIVVPPVLFTEATLPVGSLAPGGSAHKEMFAWSATRSGLKLDVLNHNPLIVWKVTPLDAAGCVDLERALRSKEANTRVRSAFRVSVTVYEQKDGKQLDQGPFQEGLSLRMDDQILSRTPVVVGRVPSEVDIPTGDHGKINLGSFQSKGGIKRSVPLWTDRGTTLTLAKHPLGMRVKLAESPKDSTPSKRNWHLNFEIDPGSQVGPLPEDSAVILRTQSANPRQIRIPILGTAVQG